MESGIIELAPIFTGSTATTAEEMKEYVQGVVTRFCKVTDLTVIETVDHERGVCFILGEEGNDQGIITIGNANHVNYYFNYLTISRVGVNNTLVSPITAFNPGAASGVSYTFNVKPLWMKYIKCDHGTVIGFSNNADPAVTYTAKALIQKVRNTLREEMALLWIYSPQIMASYSGLLENDNKDTALFTFGGADLPVVPADKEAVSEVYLASGAELYGMKLYTNKKGVKAMNKVTINSKQYVVAVEGSPFSIIMEASVSGVAGL